MFDDLSSLSENLTQDMYRETEVFIFFSTFNFLSLIKFVFNGFFRTIKIFLSSRGKLEKANVLILFQYYFKKDINEV